jgi:hypothetical protein
MQIIFIIVYFIPIIIAGAMDRSVALGMVLLSLAVPPVVDLLAVSREGKMFLMGLWVILYYGIALNMLMTWLGHPLFE